MATAGALTGNFSVDGFIPRKIKIEDQNITEVIEVHNLNHPIPHPIVSHVVESRRFRFLRGNLISDVLSIILLALLLSTIGLVLYKPAVVEKLSFIKIPTYRTNTVIPEGSLVIKDSAFKQTLNHIRQQPISLDLNGKVVNPTSSDISKWLGIAADQNSTILTVNKPAITSYVDQLISQNSSQPVDQVTVTHPDGTTYTLINGSNGVQFSGASGIVNSLSSKLLGGGGNNLTVPSTPVAYSTTGSTEYSTLLEVNVTTKRMYAYQNGSLIRTFLITAGAPATPTPLGTFKIWDKLPIQTMTGYNPNGTKYVQPNVPWINYFNHDGDAIHGNYWRPASYFGNINSSHGCVGVSVSDAEWIYNWAPIGTTVVIHA